MIVVRGGRNEGWTFDVTEKTDLEELAERSRPRSETRLVWEAMFTPDKMRRWMMPPPGWTMTVCECEARVGGALRVVWKNVAGETELKSNLAAARLHRMDRRTPLGRSLP